MSTGFLWANVNLVTTVEDIDYRGVYERTGTISFVVDGNDFWLASPEQPVYVRIRLQQGARLAESLVPPHVDPTQHRPIYLCGLLAPDSPSTMSMDPAGMTIVRWNAGEPDIWLRVTDGSSDWLNGPSPFPSLDDTVIFRIGITAAQSLAESQPLFLMGKATRASNADVDGNPASTEIRADVSQSILTRYPNPNSELIISLQTFWIGTEGVSTFPDSSQIVLGINAGTNFAGDGVIAIAHALNRSVPTLGAGGSTALVGLLVFGGLAITRFRSSTRV